MSAENAVNSNTHNVLDDIKNSTSTANNNNKRIPNEKSKFYIRSKLKEIRDADGFKDYFPLDQYDYFVETLPSHASLGKFFEFSNIPSKLISNARQTILKSKPSATQKQLQKHLTHRFYGNTELYDRDLSFVLNQCLRSGSDCFDNAKKFLIEEGYNIVKNEFY